MGNNLMVRTGSLAAAAAGAILLAACSQSPQEQVAAACEETQDAKDCECAVKLIERTGQIERIANNIGEPAVRRSVQATARACKAGIVQPPAE